ncbi:MarR family winged helix-turn-helix transcriptional regulator [Goodfellowiella coeruleoviolacea]|uniref:DNA-binding transcriptional regulator, MarR family n=1 Tax=Goodfellowiella coeruleoviolacea TaxID=334858 RepID=A0AAE3GDW4_9PSEU|nr:MarR family transcriptional regulator [Goodfellowiella coeruleoviolacea]MCP2165555.1 DNA-binding transcriptional regulator, MarR family [Goodfellowiella coeruleoviolacea]
MSVDDVLPALEQELAAMWRRARAAGRAAARELHPRLDPTAYPLVLLLFEAGPLRMSDLAAGLLLDKSTVTRQVDAAARLGLVERTTDPGDARARLVALTPAGRDRLTALLTERRTHWRAALASWDRDEVVALTRLLHKLGNTGIG